MTVGALAEAIGGRVIGDKSITITGISSVEDAEAGSVVVAEDKRYLESALLSPAAAVVTSQDGDYGGKTVIKVADTNSALLTLLEMFQPETCFTPGIDENCHIGTGFNCGANPSVGWGAYVGENVTFGDNVVIHPNVYIGDGVVLGSDVVIHPNVTVYPNTEVGNRVVIHSGSVIGADGFGYAFRDGSHRKIPQVGKVVIEDDVEIGACSAIDRAKFGITRIGSGTKIDNLVHVAHNCKVGRNVLLVAQAGVAGSCAIGDYAVLAGQTGVKDHVRIGDRAVIAARAGVIGDVESGETYSGFPARNHKEQMRAQAAFYRLPDLLKQIKDLQARVAALETQAESDGDDVGAR